MSATGYRSDSSRLQIPAMLATVTGWLLLGVVSGPVPVMHLLLHLTGNGVTASFATLGGPH